MPAAAIDRRVRLATAWGVGIGALAYFLVLSDLGVDLGRTAVASGYASNLFDLQAKAFLHGHLDVPRGSLGIEGFVIHGRTYMYFPPFPALLRIPIMLVTHEYDGHLTLVSMALAWVVFAIMAVKLFWLVRTCIRGSEPIGRTETVVAAILLAAVTGGTVLVFDASLPWAYHEVYVWATALAGGSLYWLLRVSLDPTRKAVWWLVAFNLCLIMTRTTGGAALCAASLAVAVWLLTGRPHPGRWRTGWAVLAAGLVPIAISVTYNMVKFNHPYLFPLQDQVWTSVNAHRREALARNGGTITGPQFLLSGLVNYLRPDGIRFTDYFPWVSLPARPAPSYGGAFLDQTYRTGSATAFMPFLFLASLWGTVRVFARRRAPLPIRALRLPLLGAVVIPVGVLDYGYLAHRYTTEFVPFLVLGAMIGCADLGGRLERSQLRVRVPAVGLMAALTAFSVLTNVLIGYTSEQQTWGGAKLAQYVRLQVELGGSVPVARSASLPASAPTDQLRIIGDCDGLYLSSGDQYTPWLTVQTRQLRARVVIGSGGVHPGELRLFTVSGVRPGRVGVEFDGHGRLRFTIVSGPDFTYGRWLSAFAGDELDVALTTRPEYGLIEVDALPGGMVGYLPQTGFDQDWLGTIAVAAPALSGPVDQQAAGVQLALGVTPAPSLCTTVARNAGITMSGG